MEEFSFKVDSALLSELGEKLVESEHVALVELVKNSYDADSIQVRISINYNNDESIVVIEDDGIGMSFDTIQKYWMRIATTNKAKNNISELYGRSRTGEKGIGRFACRRLGTSLKLTTTAYVDNYYETTEITFNWLDFKAGTDVDEIKCYGKKEKNIILKTGTTLVISGNNNIIWKEGKLKFIQRNLAVLVGNRGIKRKGYNEDPGFNIKFSAPDFFEDIVDLREKVIDSGWGVVIAEIDEEGFATYNLNALEIGRKKIKSKEKYNNLKDVKLKIGIIPEKKSQLKDPTLISNDFLHKFLPDWGGVQIRYKGFRVYPYGNDDWLNIDKDRGLSKLNSKNDQLISESLKFAEKNIDFNPQRYLIALLSMHGYVGQVEIGENSAGFQMKASRE
jgi:hypothetical protein